MPKTKQTETCAIHVGEFPTIVWRVFTAHCKAQGKRIAEVLEGVLREWIAKQQDKGRY